MSSKNFKIFEGPGRDEDKLKKVLMVFIFLIGSTILTDGSFDCP
jgi:hypothetical protein